MKKLTLFIILTMCFTFLGCKSSQSENITGGWNLQTNYIKTNIPEDAKKAFDNALKKYDDSYIEPVALLGTQVVAGTNYMFFCKETKENTASWKIIIIYKDLSGKSTITKIKDFDINKYSPEEENKKQLAGGWNTYMDNYQNALDAETQMIFENAIKNDSYKIEYKTLALLGTQVVAGTNYAILAVAKDLDENTSIYLFKIYNDLGNNSELISKNYIDLANFNK